MTPETMQKIRQIHSEIGFIKAQCGKNIARALGDEAKRKAVIMTLITIGEHLQAVCEITPEFKVCIG